MFDKNDAEILSEKGSARNQAVALVYKTIDVETRFMETMLYNRGYNVRVFDSVLKAEDWLN